MNCYLMMSIVMCVAVWIGTEATILKDLQLKKQIHSKLIRANIMRLKLQEKRRILQERGQSAAGIKTMLEERRRFRQTHVIQKPKVPLLKIKIIDILNEQQVTSKTKKNEISVTLTSPVLSTSSTTPNLSTSSTTTVLSTVPTSPVLSTSSTTPILSTVSTSTMPITRSTTAISSATSTPPMPRNGSIQPISKTAIMVKLPTSAHTQNFTVSQTDRSGTTTGVSSTEVKNPSVSVINTTGSTEPPPKQVTSSTKTVVPSVTTNITNETKPTPVREEIVNGFLSTARTTRDPLEDQILFGPLGVAVLEDVVFPGDVANQVTQRPDQILFGPLGVAVLEDVVFPGDVANQVTQRPTDIPESRESRPRQRQQVPRSDIVAGFMSKINNWFASRRGTNPSKGTENDTK